MAKPTIPFAATRSCAGSSLCDCFPLEGSVRFGSESERQSSLAALAGLEIVDACHAWH